MNKNIMSFIGFDSEFEESQIVLFGAPYDGTVSFRPGTRFAPEVIRKDSYGLETYSPYHDDDLEEYSLFDSGDIEFPFGNRDKTLSMIEERTREIVSTGKIPFMVGGEHLVTYPAVKAVTEKYEDLVVIHFDAHADLREDYLGEKLSHATVIRRVWDMIGDKNIYQFGIRSGTREEFKWAEEHVYMRKFDLKGIEEAIEMIGDRPVYVTIDLDVLDPSIFAGTGTPEPGGVSYKELQEAIIKLKKLNIVGSDVVELSPQYDVSGVSTAVACKVIRELVLSILG
ncbi:agmatinase [Oceanirhabdus sp. W0125-5]|uniref:agmatinase n=1 Tax=Oceanirhabdus sp. W0125-5 TaxID=2999116 RepID=UPI0022F2BC2D|nr:agmatinase [Oceanirhabdus sp. W0125-5]WBW98183.1 agmatinase [Oceanirhabdus sp. W0125-5]